MKLTPKEKAKQLIKDFGDMESTTFHDGYPEKTSIDDIYLSKQCALRCINEILENFGTLTEGKDHYSAHITIKYYEEVKEEILNYQ
jgi:hypothetical protein